MKDGKKTGIRVRFPGTPVFAFRFEAVTYTVFKVQAISNNNIGL